MTSRSSAGRAGCSSPATVTTAVLLAGTALLPAAGRVPAWGVLDAAYLAGFTALMRWAAPAELTALMVSDALIERFGLLIIIVLGETLTGVVTGLAREPVSGLTLAVGLVAVVIGFGAWWTYFDFVGRRPPRPRPWATLSWVLAHLPLTAAIAAMGAAMTGLIEHAHDGRTPAATAWTLCAGAAVVLAATMLVAATLTAWDDDRGLYRPLARSCAVAAVACLAAAAVRAPAAVPRPRDRGPAQHSLDARGHPQASPRRALARRQGRRRRPGRAGSLDDRERERGRAAPLDQLGDLVPVDPVRGRLGGRPGHAEADQAADPPRVHGVAFPVELLVRHCPL